MGLRRPTRWLWLAGALLLLLNAVLVLGPPSWIEERWLAGPWTAWPALTARLHGLAPMGLTLPLLAVVTVGVLAWALWRPPRWRRALMATLAWVALLALTFVPAWGAAYRRAPLASSLQLEASGADAAALLQALERLVAVTAASAPAAPLTEIAATDALDDAVAAAARCVADADAAVTGRRVALPPRVRTLPPGTLLRSGYAGISLPWLLEPHVDAALPPAAFLAVAAHELTHAAGWAREADTDALSVLAAVACEHPWVRYAGALHGVQVVSTSLRPLLVEDAAGQAQLQASLAALPAEARADRAALAEAVRTWHSPHLAAAVTAVYDSYLRSQGVSAGVADYAAAGAVVGAALAACRPDTTWPWCH